MPDGPSTERLVALSKALGVPVLAGLLEADGGRLFNTYVAAAPEGFVAKHRKLHPFINEHLSAGDGYTVFELLGCTFGLLICYDIHDQAATMGAQGAARSTRPSGTTASATPCPSA